MVSTKRRAEAYKHKSHRDNHVIWPGSEAKLGAFLHKPFGGLQGHKLRNALSSHSEDALTWSCFDVLRNLDPPAQDDALHSLWRLAYKGAPLPKSLRGATVQVGRPYGKSEKTEVDASIETPRSLVFIEAKLYSPMSQADPTKHKPHNQIARKLRVGAREALASGRDFYFIVVDIAPPQMLRQLEPRVTLREATRTTAARGFKSKWLTAYWFERYQSARGGSLSPLREVLADVEGADAARVARNMGWLTWADVFKVILQATVNHAHRP